MTAYKPDEEITEENKAERPCWRDMLFNALSGLYPTDQQLEQMMDHLERTP